MQTPVRGQTLTIINEGAWWLVENWAKLTRPEITFLYCKESEIFPLKNDLESDVFEKNIRIEIEPKKAKAG